MVSSIHSGWSESSSSRVGSGGGRPRGEFGRSRTGMMNVPRGHHHRLRGVRASVAQLVEQVICNDQVTSSNLVAGFQGPPRGGPFLVSRATWRGVTSGAGTVALLALAG